MRWRPQLIVLQRSGGITAARCQGRSNSDWSSRSCARTSQAVRISSEIEHRCDRRHRDPGGRLHPGNRQVRGCSETPESLARGMLPKGLPANPGELPVSAVKWASVRPNPTTTRSPGTRVLPAGSEQALDEQQPVAKGDQRRQLRADEQSYEPIDSDREGGCRRPKSAVGPSFGG